MFKSPNAALAAALLFGLLSAGSPDSHAGVRLTGSGASFPFPLYSTWFKTFSRANRGVIVDYQAKGSGSGIRDFINETVDFGASDAAMTDAEMAAVDRGVQLLPITAGAIVLTYNLDGIPALKLPRAIYPEIFMGDITRWDDPKIAAANPGVTLPSQPITVVRRADSSGTTYAFTHHLSAVNSAWAERFGEGKTVQWPASDKFIAAPKNDGVTATIRQTPGAIGYVEFAYAKFSGLPTARLENASGVYVEASQASAEAALAGVELPDDMRVWVHDPGAEEAWPIVTFTWILAYETYSDGEKARVLREVMAYCLGEGQAIAERLGYVRLPEPILKQVRQQIERIH